MVLKQHTFPCNFSICILGTLFLYCDSNAIPARSLIDFSLRLCFLCCYFTRHISNLNFRKDTFLNANSYFSFTSLNYPHSCQNPFIWKAVNMVLSSLLWPCQGQRRPKFFSEILKKAYSTTNFDSSAQIFSRVKFSCSVLISQFQTKVKPNQNLCLELSYEKNYNV